jgi:hypothetical protein
MAYNVHLNRLAVGNTAKMFESNNYGTFIINWSKDFNSSVLSPYNFFDTVTSAQISVMYPTSAFTVSSFIKTSSPTENTAYLEETCPNPSGYIHIAQLNNTIIGIGAETTQGIRAKFITEQLDLIPLSSSVDIESLKTWQEIPQYVAMYLPSAEIALSANNEDAFAPIYLLSGANFNFFSEIPCENQDLYFDFFNGVIQVNSGNMKNEYDPIWNVSATVSKYIEPISGLSYVTGATLKDCRIYENLNVNGNCLWAVYSFGRDYTNETSALCPSSIGYFVESNIKPTIVPMIETSGTWVPPTSAHQYEYIERIVGMNRFSQIQLHKSNLFSISIRDSGLNSAWPGTSADQLLAQNSINNILESMIRKLAPAYTTLFKIYYIGE